MVTIRIRSWRPAMPSISGPRSTVASNFTVTPFVSGATCSLLIVLSSLQGRSLRVVSGQLVDGLEPQHDGKIVRGAYRCPCRGGRESDVCACRGVSVT